MEFMDEILRRLATEGGRRPDGWSVDAVRVYRETIQCVDAAKTDADLRALRSLRMRSRPDLKAGAWSVRLDDALVLVLSFKNGGAGATTVLEFLDTDPEGMR